ncbi:MAG: tetratricopeptide repeat protein [Bacteroidia bacterium]
MRFAITFILLLPTLVFSKDFTESLDSLSRQKTDAVTEENLSIVLKLTQGYMTQNPDKALDYGYEAFRLAEKLGLEERSAQAFDFLGRIHDSKGNLILASDCFERGLEMAIVAQNAKLIAHLNNSLGVIYSKKGDNKLALTHFIQAKNEWEALGNYRQMAIILNNMCALNVELKNYDAAISAVNQALEVNKDDDLPGHAIRGQSYNNKGSVYEETGQFDKALANYLLALEEKKHDKKEVAVISTLTSIASVYARMNDEAESARFFNEALAIAQQSQDKYWLHYLYKLQGERLEARGNYDQAKEYYLKSLDLASLMDAKNTVLDLRKNLSRVYSRTRDYDAALMHQLIYNELKDSMVNEKSMKQLAEIQSLYQFEEQQKKIYKLEAEQEIGRIQKLGLILFSLLLLVAFAGFFSRYRLKQRANRLLERQKSEILERNNEIENQNQLLESQNKEIEAKNQLLEQQARAINSQNRQLKQTNDELEQFAYAASHDLREPLRTIRSYMQLLEKRYKGNLDGSAHEFINYATSGAVRMDELLQDLLEYSRIGRMDSQKVSVNLNQVLESVKENLAHQIAQSHAVIEVKTLPEIYGFRAELSLLFQNLISNAIKFSKPGISPRVLIQSQVDNGNFLISVTDNGIGIEPQYQHQIFSLFKRLHTREEYDGSGLGLAICHKIMLNHGGKIWLDSEPGLGSTFHVLLPGRNEVIPENGMG